MNISPTRTHAPAQTLTLLLVVLTLAALLVVLIASTPSLFDTGSYVSAGARIHHPGHVLSGANRP